MKTLAVYNLKGGVGKTTAVVNFAYFAAQEGNRTLLWDLDPQGAATFHFRVTPKVKIKLKQLRQGKQKVASLINATEYPNLDLIPASFKLRHLDVALDEANKGTQLLTKLISKLAARYDFLFFDCPPSLSALAQSIFQASDYLVIPLIPTTLAVQTFQRMQRYFVKHFKAKPQLIPFFSMVDQRKSLHNAIIEHYTAEAGLFCHAVIPTRSEIEKMGLHRAPLPFFSPDSKATLEFQALWHEIKTRI